MSTKIVHFLTTGAGVPVLGYGQSSHIVRMLNFFKIRQTKYIVMLNKEGSTKIMNFTTHRVQ